VSDDTETDDWFESDSTDETDELEWDDWETGDDSDSETGEPTEPTESETAGVRDESDGDETASGSLTAGFDDIGDSAFTSDVDSGVSEPSGEDGATGDETAGSSGSLGSSEFFGSGDVGTGELPSEDEMDAPFAEDTAAEETLGETAGDGFDEAFESDIPRIDTGVAGLDQMIQGGVPARSLMVVMGSAGTGKTTFGLQFANRGVENGEKAVYITLEETREAIIAAASEKGWDFEQYADENKLAIVDLDPIEMANSLSSIRSDLPRLIDDFGAERLVLDSVSLLEMMYDDQAKRRTEVFDFTKSLKKSGVTTMLTSEGSEDNPYVSRHGIIEYLTDAVFVLQYVRSEFQETRLAVEIQKIRNANHSRETKPYEITDDGISVYQQANIF